MNQILPIIMIMVFGLGSLIALFFLRSNDQNPKSKKETEDKTAQDFTNVAFIQDQCLHTRDGQVLAYIKIQPISIELFSDMEKGQIARILTAELSSFHKPFKFIALSRPVDISIMIQDYREILETSTDQGQKELVRQEMSAMSTYALSGQVVERQFYLVLWARDREGADKDLLKDCDDLVQRFESANITTNIIGEQEILRLINMVNNPAYTYLENLEE